MKKSLPALLVFLFSLSTISGQGPAAYISVDIPEACAPGQIIVYNSSDTTGITGIARWEWNIAGVTYTDYEPVVPPLEAGTYQVRLTLIDDFGPVSTASQEITIYPTFGSFTISTGASACPGEKVTFWYPDEVNAFFVEWDFGDGSFKDFTNNQNYPEHIFYEAGSYDVSLIIDHACVSNANPDTLVQTLTISGAAVPQVNAYTKKGPEFCPNDPVEFDVDGDFASYSWNFGDGNTSTEKDPLHYYDTQLPADYTVTLSATNICGQSDTDTLSVSFVEGLAPDAMFDYYTYDGNSFTCPNTPVQFYAHGAGFFEWDFGDGGYSNEPDPVNYFPGEGVYHVKLTVTNGCGNTATYMDSIQIFTNPDLVPFPDFYFDMDDSEQVSMFGDTVYVCPGEVVKFRNTTYTEEGLGLSYTWNFGDGTSSNATSPSHVYSGPGLYFVSLSATNACNGQNSITKYVEVNSLLPPSASLGVVPEVICDGETVFFYDDLGTEGNKVYNIDFGDGNTLSNITTYTDTILQTLASHVYTGTPGTSYNYLFEVVNQCGNTNSKEGSITITDDPTIKPFYYVSNSTSMDEGEPRFEDWSRRRDPTDHKITIHFNWPGYPGGQNNFAVYLWYGGFSGAGGPDGPANGFVEFTSSTIVAGDSVDVYVPINPLFDQTVGFAVGWSCEGIYPKDEEPDVWGQPRDFTGLPITSVPIVPGGYTDMLSLGNPFNLDQQGWDGICKEERLDGAYYYQINPTTYMQLNISEGDGLYYELYPSKDQEGYDPYPYISTGYISYLTPDTVVLDESFNCYTSSRYQVVKTADQLVFTSIDDTACVDQEKYLTMNTFQKRQYPEMEGPESLAACPGDKVQFQVAGGVSWEWHFGDGSTSNVKYPVHTYASPGTYDAYVVATNSCGRTDTVYSTVEVSSEALPLADFWFDTYTVNRLEEISFETFAEYIDQAGNYSYLWDFGDGTTSTVPLPTHTYDKRGDYTISLTVTNGCGSSTNTDMIRVTDVVLECQAKFSIDSVVSNMAYFSDQSRGKIKSWYWEFGDGTVSKLPDPSHQYQREGVYYVCLSVYDSLNDCSTQICREVAVGTVDCQADFTSVVNESTNTVRFSDRSLNVDEYFWDFGDGNFADVPDTAYQYSEPGLYTVCLYVRNSSTGCYAEVCREIAVGLADTVGCYADFKYFVDETDNTVRFTDASSTNITNWYWTFGDGKYVEERSPSHTYPGPGAYEVCLIVFDAETGCVAEKCIELIVGADACRLSADFANFIDINNNTVTFNDRSNGIVTNWFWDFGDGTTSSKMNPVHQYAEPGFYLVTLSVWDENTGCNDYTAQFLKIGAVDCRSAFDFQVDGSGLSVKFANKSIGDIDDYFWYFDDGNYSDVKDPVHQYERPGWYYVSLTVVKTNASGDIICMDFYEEAIQVGEVSCAADFKYFIDSTTNMGYFSPEARGTATDYLWTFGDGSMYNQANVKHQFKYPGYHHVGLNTYNAENNCMDYHEVIVLIGSEGVGCQAGFIYRSDPATGDVQFKDESRGNIVNWIWDFGDGNISQVENPKHNYPERGYYLVCLTAVNANGIANTFCDWVQVASSDAERCFAQFNFSVDSASKRVSFVEESYGKPDQWQWDFGDGTGSTDQNPFHTYPSAGYYLVKLTSTNSTTGCSSTARQLVNVSSGNQGLKAGFDYEVGEPNTKADSYPVDFVGVSVGEGGRLKWLFGDGSSDTTSLNPTHVYTSPGEYAVCLTVFDPVSGDKDQICQSIETASATGIDPSVGAGPRIAHYPNPTSGITHILYHLSDDTFVDMALYDNTGRIVEWLVRKDQAAGDYRMEYDASVLDSGIYTLRLATRQGVYITRMVVQ